MAVPRTLVELVRERGRDQSDRSAYGFLLDGETLAEEWTFADLDRRSRSVAASLADRVAPGDRVVVAHASPAGFLTAAFGAWYAGAAVVPFPHVARPIDLARVAGAAGAALALVDRETEARLRAAAVPVRCQVVEDVPLDRDADWREPAVRADALAVVQFTSGSTATPKGVPLSHDNVLANQRMITAAFGHDDSSTFVGWLPLFHDMGIMGNALQPLHVGARSVLMPPAAFLERPARWLRAISRHGARTSGGPNFGYALCTQRVRPEELAGVDLSGWRVAFNGAEPVSADTLDRFARAFAPFGFRPSAFYPCYGMAEATLFVSGGAPGRGARVLAADAAALEAGRVVAGGAGNQRRLVSCGQLAEGMSARIDAPDGSVGEILLSGPNLCRSYWGGAAADRFIDDGERRFLRTGDLAALVDGELFVLGRVDDLLIVRGRNVHPHDLEESASACHPDLRPGCAAAFTVGAEDGETRLVIVQELRRDIDRAAAGAVAAAIRGAVAEHHAVAVADVALVARGAIPRTTSGKIRRRACKALYQGGKLPPAVRETAAAAPDGSSWLRAAVAELLALDPSLVPTDRSLVALGLDSLGIARLAHRIQDALGVHPTLDALIAAPSIDAIAAALAAAPRGAAPADPPAPLPVEQPLSDRQRAMWFFQEYAPGSTVYHVACAARLVRPVEIDRLRRAVETVVERHPILRSVFRWQDGEPRQVLAAPSADLFRELAATGLDEAAFDRALEQEARRPFSLADGPSFRVTVWSGGPRGQVLLIAAHHILVDLWSLALLFGEIDALVGGVALPPAAPEIELGFAAREARRAAELVAAGREAAALDRLRGARPLELPAARERGEGGAYALDSARFAIDSATADALRQRARELEVSLYSLLVAAYGTVLHRYCGADDFLIGSPTWGRESGDLRRAVGCFVNTMVVRCRGGGDPTFAELARLIHREVVAALGDAEIPYPQLMRRRRAEGPATAPVDALFTMQKAPVLDGDGLGAFALGLGGRRLALDHLELESLPLSRGEFEFPLDLAIAEVDGGLAGYLATRSALVPREIGARMAAHFVHLLGVVAREPAWRVSSGEILTADEREEMVTGWNPAPEPPHGTLLDLIDRQVRARPDHPAVIGSERTLSFAELDGAARRLASLLVPGREPVGLLLEPGPDWTIAMLAALRARRPFVPLDRADPAQRLAALVDDAGITTVIVSADDRERLTSAVPRLRLLAPGDGAGAAPLEGAPAALDDVVYIVYTSGSTGAPKGVPIDHQNLDQLMRWLAGEFAIGPATRTLESLTVCFDFGLEEVLSTLCAGGTLVALPPERRRDPDETIDLLARHQITMAYWTPSLCAGLVARRRPMPTLRVILLGGEALDRSLIGRLRPLLHPDCQVFNGYGPTEAAINSTMYRIGADQPGDEWSRTIPIGRPSGQSRVYLLSAEHALVPVGVPGELYIGGTGVARGYLGRAELTAERFLPDPFRPGRSMYRTGDRVRWLPGGNLEFLGRIDRQVKLRGYRIEPGEIESVIRRTDGVADAAVAVLDEGALWAFVVPAAGIEDTAPLRRAAAQRLPGYMQPSRWLLVDRLPMTANGKVDHAALAALAQSAPGPADGGAPKNQVEAEILQVWRDVLELPTLGRHINFFDVGGHSLLAVSVQRELERRLARKIPVALLFEHPTAALLAENLTQSGAPRAIDPHRGARMRSALRGLHDRQRKKDS